MPKNNERAKNQRIYLENIEESIEFLFAHYGAWLTNKRSHISYLNAFYLIGAVIYPNEWTGREFFASVGSSIISNFHSALQKKYKIFRNKKSSDEAALRRKQAEAILLSYLKDDAIKSFYHDPKTGESIPLPSSFWASNKCSYSLLTGRIQQSVKPTLNIPGHDLIIVVSRKDIKKACKEVASEKTKKERTEIKKTKLKKTPFTPQDFREAKSIVLKACDKGGLIMNKIIFAEALNRALGIEYFNQNNIRPEWEFVDAAYCSRKGGGRDGNTYLDAQKIKMKKIKLVK